MILKTAGQAIKHNGDGHHAAGVGVDIGMQEKALGNKHGEKAEGPLQPFVPKPFSAEKQDKYSHYKAENKIHHTGSIEKNISVLRETSCQTHGIALNHIGQNGLESIGKAVGRNADGFVKTVGESTVFRNVLRNQIAVELVRRIAEGLLP